MKFKFIHVSSRKKNLTGPKLCGNCSISKLFFFHYYKSLEYPWIIQQKKWAALTGINLLELWYRPVARWRPAKTSRSRSILGSTKRNRSGTISRLTFEIILGVFFKYSDFEETFTITCMAQTCACRTINAS
jgi:hypothetical protein